MRAGDRWFFDRVACVYDRFMPPIDRSSLEAGFELADGPVRRVLDVGGGTGRAVSAVHTPSRVVVDLSPGMLRQVPPGIDRVLASATALPVADGTIDAVLVVDALHHMPDHDRVLAEGYRVLRPGGVLVVREFDRTTIRGRLVRATEHAIGMRSTFRSMDELRDRFEALGFETAVLEWGFTGTVAGRKPGGP